MCGLLGLHYIPLYPHGLGTTWVEAPTHLAHLTSISVVPLLAMLMGLLVVILIMLAH